MRKLLLIGLICFCIGVAEAKEVGLTITVATTSGTIPRGARGITLMFSSAFTGTVAGATFTGTTDTVPVSLPITNGDTFSAISYTVTAGNVRILTTR